MCRSWSRSESPAGCGWTASCGTPRRRRYGRAGERPRAESGESLSAAVVIDQKPLGGNVRSTVGTAMDVRSVLRVLFSRYGTPSAGGASAHSFNDPAGMCPECDGVGHVVRLDLDRAVDWSKSLNEGALLPGLGVGSWEWNLYGGSGRFDNDLPLREFGEEDRGLSAKPH